MITFRQVVAQAAADALGEPDAKAMVAALPVALKRRLAQAGYVVKRAVPEDIGGEVLTYDLHAQHHPTAHEGCYACRYFAQVVSDAP